jgi:hypothetical protein
VQHPNRRFSSISRLDKVRECRCPQGTSRSRRSHEATHLKSPRARCRLDSSLWQACWVSSSSSSSKSPLTVLISFPSPSLFEELSDGLQNAKSQGTLVQFINSKDNVSTLDRCRKKFDAIIDDATVGFIIHF